MTTTDLDVEEVGRRLRALFIALGTPNTHLNTAALYDRLIAETFPASSTDEHVEGSWGWWAKKVLEPTP